MQRDSGVGLSAAALKWIAAAAMTADHIGIVFSAALPAGAQLILRTAGRIALPAVLLFCRGGRAQDGRPGRYALRLLAFALVSEVPFDLMLAGRLFDLHRQNVLFTLLLGLLGGYWQADRLGTAALPWPCCARWPVGRAQLARTVTACSASGSSCFSGFCRRVAAARGAFVRPAVLVGRGGRRAANRPVAACGLLALPLIRLYGGRRGRGGKYAFYVYYPLHMLLLYLLSRL